MGTVRSLKRNQAGQKKRTNFQKMCKLISKVRITLLVRLHVYHILVCKQLTE